MFEAAERHDPESESPVGNRLCMSPVIRDFPALTCY